MPRIVTPQSEKMSKLFAESPDEALRFVQATLKLNGGNVSKCAQAMNIPVRQLWRWIKKNPSILEDTGHHGRVGRRAPAEVT